MSQLPNALTLLRLCMVPLLAWLILTAHYPAALWLMIAAGLSDALDGFLAKQFGWVSRFGSILDPLADKCLLLTAFACLASMQLLPWWLLILSLTRDLIIVSGAIAYQLLIAPVSGAPNWASKANTAAQIVLVTLVLLQACDYLQAPQLGKLLIWLVCILSLSSLLQYVVIWSHKTWQHYQQET